MQVAKGFINHLPSRNTQTTRFIFSASKREISKAIQGSEIQSRGRYYATSAPSEDPKPKKVNKKVSKVERKAKVEAFVNKYRESNAGKFPTPKNAQKEVGGSYYIVRQIVQEIQYNSKVSPSERKKQNPSTTESTERKETLAVGEKVIVSPITTDLELRAVSNVEVNDASNNSSKANEGLQKNTLAEKPLPVQAVESQTTNNGTSFDGVATETHLQHGQTNEVEDSLKKGSNGENLAENLQDSEDNKSDPKQPEESHLKADKLERDLIKKQSNEETQQKTNIWGSLKSLADGFINIWKKL